MVEAMKTKYGPSSFFTSGSGMAAASSMTSSSAWPSFTASAGWMYWRRKMKKRVSNHHQQLSRRSPDVGTWLSGTWMVCRCSLKMLTRTTALLNSGFSDWMIS